MTEIVFSGAIRVPVWVQDLDSFRRWCLSEDFPDQGNISFLNGQLWVDPSMERDLHNQIKTAITAVLFLLVQSNRLGRFYSDNMRLVHPEAGLSTEGQVRGAGHSGRSRRDRHAPRVGNRAGAERTTTGELKYPRRICRAHFDEPDEVYDAFVD